ncbi:MAG: ribosome biogenesis GTPase Der [Gammaproteobacteria bacterium]|nr:ribosome biogenesis GTPase Der [Gammaproteobacteria bacterium]
MLPVVAILGRPNVGKSTLFNCLTHSQAALVADLPGVTRDRHYGFASFGKQSFIVVDTGGIGAATSDIAVLAEQQAEQAISEADILLFMVDGMDGLTPLDHKLATSLRHFHKPLILVVNKNDAGVFESNWSDFYALGLEEPLSISASHAIGIKPLVDTVFTKLSTISIAGVSHLPPSLERSLSIAVVGRPNVGKSTLINHIVGQERFIVSDEAGTTRDTLSIAFDWKGHSGVLLDTAGIRRRSRIQNKVEKFSVVKTLQAIHKASVVFVMCDAADGIVEQDLALMGQVLESGKGLIIVINKWDALSERAKAWVKREVVRKLRFVSFIKPHCISALKGEGVSNLLDRAVEVYQAFSQHYSTAEITQWLNKILERHSPPMVKGKRTQLRYAHMGGHTPPTIVVHGKRAEDLPKSYRHYLENAFRKVLHLEGILIHIEFKNG